MVGCLTKNGHHVIGVDKDPEKVKFISTGKSTVIEKNIDKIIYHQHKLGNISATLDSFRAVQESEVSFICVGTPSTENGHLELNAIYKVAEDIGAGIRKKRGFHVVVIRSTVLPGTNEKVAKLIEQVSRKKRDKDFTVVSNPEFLREGSAVEDFLNPCFTLIGSTNKKATRMMKGIYKGINGPFVVTDVNIAEIIKYVNNGFHALKVTFSNEIGKICKKMGIDSHQLMKIFCMDNRLNLSPNYLKPGFSYGGSCLPKDLKALCTIAHDFYIECPVLENIGKSNELHSRLVLEQIIKFGKHKIGFLGLSFKAGTDDLRNSPIIDIIEQLLGKGFEVKIYDKNVHFSKLRGANREFILQKIPFISKFLVGKPEKVTGHCDVIVVVNREEGFSEILNNVSDKKIVFDLVNISFKRRANMKNYNGLAW
jgi:GDP-mannose 6-dehydrogenase